LKSLFIPGASSGSYVLLVTGTEAGTFTLDFQRVASDGSTAGVSQFGIVSNSAQLEYDILAGPDGVSLSIQKRAPSLSGLLQEVDTAARLKLISSAGVAQSFHQKIATAANAAMRGQTSATRGILSAFVKEVQAQSGQFVSNEAASFLTSEANLILAQ
jgi:hypothetical protein